MKAEIVDRIGKNIVDLINEELQDTSISPLHVLLGELLALLSYMKTMPKEDRPPVLLMLEVAVEESILQIGAAIGVSIDLPPMDKNLFDVAKEICHKHGFDWTDPRTGITHKPPKERVQ